MNINDQETIKVDDEDWKIDETEEGKKEILQDLEPITIEQMNDAIKESKKIILFFVKEKFGNDILDKVSDTINNLNIGIDRDPKTAKSCVAYYSYTDGVYLTENYCREKKDNIMLIHTIIHEYAHSFSDLLSKGEVNAVVEEALANLFAEMSINNYIQKGNRINYLSENDNDILANNNGYYEQNSYISEGEFTRGIMYALQTKNMDIDALREYFFGSKEKFVDMCEQTLGYHLRIILTKDLANIRNQLGVKDNTTSYLPQALEDLRNILANYINYPLDENAIKQHKNGEESALYSIDGSLMDRICCENRLRYEWLQKIDFSNIRRDNAKQIFSKLSVEDIQELSKKTNGKIKEICSQWGYSNFMKLLIRGWYEVTKENLSNFEEIMSLTGGIPFDVFQKIMNDKEVTNSSDIMHFLVQYHLLNNEDNYSSILELLNQNVGNEFDKVQYCKQAEDDGNTLFYLNENLLEVLSKLNLSNDDLQKILYIYNIPLSQITPDNILNIIDILNKIDYSTLSKDDLNNLFGLENNIANYLVDRDKIDDIGLLIKIGQLPHEAREDIENGLIFDNLELYDDVGLAISTLKKYGYEIENEYEILDCIMNSDYGNIRIIPNFNVETLLAFTKEKDKTNILLSACINQFLESDSSMLFDDKNFDICLMLLDDNIQELLGISDVMTKRICSIIQKKMQKTSEISREQRNKLEEKIKIRYNLFANDEMTNMVCNAQELIENGVNCMKELTEEEKENFLEWSEGNKYLYELLCSCWENGIMTYASCGGHENGNNSPYLGIIINNNSLPYIKSMLSQIQNMENIVVSSGVRGNGQLLGDKELREIAFYAHNYNCCELFYKMRKGIEAKEAETTLLPKASIFYNSLTRLNVTSREELQADVNDNIVVGSTFSTKTQDFIDFENSKKMVRNSKLIRFFRKLLPFKKLDTTRYEILQQKYGFLQREYSGERTTKMEQYRVKNLDNLSNYKKKISDIEPNKTGSSTLTRDTLHEL